MLDREQLIFSRSNFFSVYKKCLEDRLGDEEGNKSEDGPYILDSFDFTLINRCEDLPMTTIIRDSYLRQLSLIMVKRKERLKAVLENRFPDMF